MDVIKSGDLTWKQNPYINDIHFENVPSPLPHFSDILNE